MTAERKSRTGWNHGWQLGPLAACSAALALAQAQAATRSSPGGSGGRSWDPVSIERTGAVGEAVKDNPGLRRKPQSVARHNVRQGEIRNTKADEPIAVLIKPDQPGSVARADAASTVEASPATPVVAGENSAGPDAAILQTQKKDYSDAVQKFCSNIGPTAIEARTAAQKKLIAELEHKIQNRIAQLQSKIEETKEWLNRREAFAAKATAGLVQVLSRMDPEAAAAQLAQMDVETAAALLLKLDPKAAAPLLGEMPPAKAAQLASIVAASTGSLRRPNTPEQADAGKASTQSSSSSIDETPGVTGSVGPLDVSAGRGAAASEITPQSTQSQPFTLLPEDVR